MTFSRFTNDYQPCQLFGGVVDSAFHHGNGALFKHHVLIPVALQLGTWPWNRARPHVRDRETLVNPPLPVDEISTLLPASTYTKFFDQTFWDFEFAKYGHQALKIYPDDPSLTLLSREYVRRKDLQRVFGKSHGEWLTIALESLENLNQGLLTSYCNDLMIERMEKIWVRKRFHHEARVWPHRNERFDRLVSRIDEDAVRLSGFLDKANLPESKKQLAIDEENTANDLAYRRGDQSPRPQLDMPTYLAQVSGYITETFYALMASYRELHHHLLHEIRCTQTLVVDYVQQCPLAREHLHRRYGGYLYAQIESTFEPKITFLIAFLSKVHNYFSAAHMLSPGDDIDTALQRHRTYLSLDLTHLQNTKQYLTPESIFPPSFTWTDTLTTIPRGRAYKRSETMKKMATAELLKAPPAVRKLVDTFLHILGLNSLAAQEQEDAGRLDRVVDKLRREMQANPRRRDVATSIFTPSPSHTPEATGLPHRPPPNNVRPWHAGMSDPQHPLPLSPPPDD